MKYLEDRFIERVLHIAIDLRVGEFLEAPRFLKNNSIQSII